MRTTATSMTRKKATISVAIATASMLMVPLIAMQFTDEVNWNAADFAAAGILLIGIGLMYGLAASRTRNIKHKTAIGLAAAVALLLVWGELAVGLFGSPVAGS